MPAKGKGKKGAPPPAAEAPTGPDAFSIPTVEEANIALQTAEATRSAALAILDKTKAMRKTLYDLMILSRSNDINNNCMQS